MVKTLNATSKAGKCSCGQCGRKIAAGERLLVYREPALSYREASHAGTWYPKRFRCADCVKEAQ